MFLGVMQVFITLESTPETMFRADSVKYALIGLMRDLRGIAMATNRLVQMTMSDTCLWVLPWLASTLLFNVFQP